MQQIDRYVASLEGKKQDWASQLVVFIRETYPELQETFENNMPTYYGEGFFFAFAARKSYFSFFTSDTRVFSLIKELSPSSELGKSCVRLKYSEQSAVEILTDVIQEIVSYHQNKRNTGVTDFKAAQKWAKIPSHTKQLLVNNVFCTNCGETTITDYSLQDNRFGVSLEGKCNNCGNEVARLVEIEEGK